MAYKTILVHVDQSRHAMARIKIAAKIALPENAHLIGAAMTGITHYVYPNSDIERTGIFIAAHIEALHKSAELALLEFDAIAARMGVLSAEKRLLDDDASGALSLQARYCDLLVISQSDLNDSASRLLGGMPEYLMLNCGRPVLIVPCAGRFDNFCANALLAWDGSKEATRAIAASIPLLRRANSVALAVFNPAAQYDRHGEQPGADMALYLARQNIKVNVVQQSTELGIGEALLSLASDLGSDLLVMGGYGHARFREIFLGGVTKTILESMTVPVLMSH